MSEWRKKADEARLTAKEKADKAVEDELNSILDKADEIEDIFNELNLSDPTAYNDLINIVENASKKNENIASVVKRLKTLSEVGKKLTTSIGKISGTGVLKTLIQVLKEKK